MVALDKGSRRDRGEEMRGGRRGVVRAAGILGFPACGLRMRLRRGRNLSALSASSAASARTRFFPVGI